MRVYLGIDVGSVTTKLAVLNEANEIVNSVYIPTSGRPAAAVHDGLWQMRPLLPADIEIMSTAVTGSARHLVGAIVGADLVKNEITCQAIAAVHFIPDVRTVIEIGGQDSKIILIRDGMVSDFGMNTVCAAGTGSFLDHQAGRLHISIEEFSLRALKGTDKVTVSGRCTVFAESDIVHKQQNGAELNDIIYGLCRALARNFLSDVGSGKEIKPPVSFHGGVAFNQGIVQALKKELKMDIIVPEHHEIMGAVGAALLAHENAPQHHGKFKGFEIGEKELKLTGQGA
jgi:predicted CoA-substrate-specific enzyme activase